MRRIFALACALSVIAFAGAHFSATDVGQNQKLTAEELSKVARAQKLERRAEREAAGIPTGPGQAPNDWAFVQRAFPYGEINFEQYEEAIFQAQDMRRQAERNKSAIYPNWQEEGPSNIGARVTDLEFHPTNQNEVYAAMASGGIFRSVDGGTSWTAIFDDQPVLTMGDIAIDPGNPDIMWAGTGEANAISLSVFGMGMFKSTDGGSTWVPKGLADSRYIARIRVDPTNSDRVWAAVTGSIFATGGARGVYRTTDGGDSWSQVLWVNDLTAANDLAIDPTTPNTVYAAMWERSRGLTYRDSYGDGSGIWRSTDGGDTWTELTTGLPSGANVGRIGIDVCASSPNVLYASYEMATGWSPVMYKSTNGGISWSQVGGSQLDGLTSSFGWYFGQVRVDPNNSDRAWAFGVDLERTTNGGSGWSSVLGSAHVDNHAMAFDPFDATHVMLGNDGGIYESFNNGGSWSKLYDQPTQQFYAIEVDYLNPARLYGGTQDNGTMRTPTGATDDWEGIFGGDGFYTLVDPTDSDIIYCEYQYGNMYKSTDDGNNWSWGLSGVSGRTNWSSPFVLYPGNPQKLVFGAHQVWQSTDGAGSWTAISGDLTNGDQGANFGTITTLAVAPSNTDYILAGTDDSNVWITTNDGGNWTNVSGSLPTRWITRVAFDPAVETTAYVTLSGLRWNDDMAHIYKTTDAGSSWTPIQSNLPDAPVVAVLVDPNDSDVIFVGTDVGLYWTHNGGGSWAVLGTGLPATPVWDLKLHQPTRVLYAGTHGRSIWSLDVSNLPTATDVETAGTPPASSPTLAAAPNPFNPTTTIRFTLDGTGSIELEVYDLSGRHVRTLENGHLQAGEYSVRWNGKSDAGEAVGSGTYFARLVHRGGTEIEKLTLIR